MREVSLVRSRLFTKKKIADSIARQIQSQVPSEMRVKPSRQSIVPIS